MINGDKPPATERQLKLIADMEEFVGEKFHGKTKAEDLHG